MDKQKILRKLNDYLNSDLKFRIKTLKYPQDDTDNRQGKFLEHLISVATHSIGLKASISPFNEVPEHMLAYLMDLFALSETNFKKILNENSSALNQLENNDSSNNLEIEKQLSIVKKHSWRPELRLKLSAPAFYSRKQLYLDNLSVRVYIFRADESLNESYTAKNQLRNNVLDRIFKKQKQLETNALIRPIEELRCLLKFKQVLISSNNSLLRSKYKMFKVSNSNKIVNSGPMIQNNFDEDVRLNLRRYYCEPKTVHILRFEFWLNNRVKAINKTCSKQCKQFTKSLMCISSNKLDSINEKEEFYGYINIKLTQLPSYTIKQNYPILSLKGQRVNNCEINLEPRKRRILEEDEKQPIKNLDIVLDNYKPKKSRDKFIINHLRLYANCFLYQCFALRGSLGFDTLQNMTIDSLFYVPAYTLINQHRLQSNLSQPEDKCLRRAAILASIITLTKNQSQFNEDHIKKVQLILISVLQCEYIIADRFVDDKTMHELSSFVDSDTLETSGILDIEIVNVETFVDLYLTSLLKKNILNFEAETTSPDYIDRIITLSSLKLFKSICNYHKDKTIILETEVEKVLIDTITDYFYKSIISVESAEFGTIGRKSNQNSRWLKLLNKFKLIDHDLKLYWNSKGLDDLVSADEERFVELLKRIERQGFKSIIEAKLIDYLEL